MIAPRALGVVESTVVDDEKTVTFATAAPRAGRPSAALIPPLHVVEAHCGGRVFIAYGIIFLGF